MNADNQELMSRALVELRGLRRKLADAQRARHEPIAVIGVGCRFPGGAVDAQSCCDMLYGGTDAITDIPTERWNVDDYYDGEPGKPGRMYCRAGGFVQGIEQFDADFFGIAPREAAAIDPQQRMVLEASWQALEHANVSPDSLFGSSAGAFVGISSSNYSTLQLGMNLEGLSPWFGTGVAPSVSAGRLSYLLGLTGPSMVVDTACSSSLVAVHLAVRSLRQRECDLAFAGGAGAILTPEAHIAFCQSRMLSTDGRCRTFDADANGYGRGEGCGIVILKRLADALSDGDRVLAVVRGTAVNQDGRSGALTVPNGPSQVAVIRAALADAQMQPGEVTCIESHGTGTSLGDPIEMTALADVFAEQRERPLFVGSIKTNIGHLEAAAGVAGLIKTVLMLQQQRIAPHLHFRKPSPRIDWDRMPFHVPVESTAWPDDAPRVAGVSSFGFSGTNAHIVLTAAPEAEAPQGQRGADRSRPAQILALSAKTPKALQKMIGSVHEMIDTRGTEIAAADLCATANAGRAHFPYRFAGVGASLDELQAALSEAGAMNDVEPHRAAPGQPRIAMLFTGQGSQYRAMGAELYEQEPKVREILDQCAESVSGILSAPLLDVMFRDEHDQLRQTQYTQPALFALECAVAELWRSWGVSPACVLGHSIGELAAAYVAGVVSLQDGIRMAATRGQLIQKSPSGTMLAVQADESSVSSAIAACPRELASRLAIAAINSPTNTVVSGDREAVERLANVLHDAGIGSTPLNVSHAFHCSLIESACEPFGRFVASIALRRPEIDVVGNVDGEIAGDQLAKPTYWVRHLREPVRFRDGISTLHRSGVDCLIEVGPRPVLIALGRSCLEDAEHHDDDGLGRPLFLPSMRPGESEIRTMMRSLAELYQRGVDIDWREVERGRGRRSVTLPGYPFDRQRHWITLDQQTPLVPRASNIHPLVQREINAATLAENERLFESQLSVDSPSYLAHHRFGDTVLLPATALIEMALAAGHQIFTTESSAVTGLIIEHPVILDGKDPVTLQVICSLTSETEASFRILSQTRAGEGRRGTWTLHASGQIHATALTDQETFDLEAARSRLSVETGAEDFYAQCKNRGLEFGPDFQSVKHLHGGAGEALGEVALPDQLEADAGSYFAHPALLDGCLQAMSAAVEVSDDNHFFVPFSIERVEICGEIQSPLWVHVMTKDGQDAADSRELDLRVYDRDARLVARLDQILIRRVAREKIEILTGSGSPAQQPLFVPAWEPDPQGDKPSRNGSAGDSLIFVDDGGLGEELAGLLRSQGGRCFLVSPDEGFAIRSPDRFQINPGSEVEFRLLLDALSADSPLDLRTVVFLWSLNGAGEDTSKLEDLDAAISLSCRSLLNLIKALARCGIQPAPRLCIATRGARPFEHEQWPLDLRHAPLIGMQRVIALEHPELRCLGVDLDPGNGDHAAENLLQALATSPLTDQVVVRGDARYVERLQKLPSRPSASSPRFSDEATYLVSGGLGAIGLQSARWLVQQGARHVVLCGRSEPSSEALSRIAELEQLEAEVRIERADVSSRGDVVRVLESIRATMPPLRGVMHAAGVLADGFLLESPWEAFTKVMSPKVHGVWNLHELTRNDPLEFFVCFSSASAALGSPGQSNYAAGNAFMDAVAHRRRAMGLPALSVNWGPWAETGMAAALDSNQLAARFMDPIAPDVAFDLLGDLLATGLAQVAVLPLTKEFRESAWARDGRSPLLHHLALQKSDARGANRSRVAADNFLSQYATATSEAQPLMLAAYLRRSIGAALGKTITANEDHEPLSRMGMDSLMALDLKNQLAKDLSIDVALAKLIDGPSIETLLSMIGELLLNRPAGEPVLAEVAAALDYGDLVEGEI